MKASRTVLLITTSVFCGYLFTASAPRVASATVTSGTAMEPAPLNPEAYRQDVNFWQTVGVGVLSAALYDVAKAAVHWVANSVDIDADEGSMDGLTGFHPGAYIPAGALDPLCLDCVEVGANAL